MRGVAIGMAIGLALGASMAAVARVEIGQDIFGRYYFLEGWKVTAEGRTLCDRPQIRTDFHEIAC